MADSTPDLATAKPTTDGNVKGFRPKGARTAKNEFRQQRKADQRAAKTTKKEKEQDVVVLAAPRVPVEKKHDEEPSSKRPGLSKYLRAKAATFQVREDLLSDYRVEDEDEVAVLQPVEKKKEEPEKLPRLDLMQIVWTHGGSSANRKHWMEEILRRERWPQVKTVLERADLTNATIRLVKGEFDRYLAQGT
jgi:hypothetical protein